MSVTFPKRSGIIQKLIRPISEKINLVSKQLDTQIQDISTDLKNSGKDIKKKVKLSVKIPSLVESPLFEPVKDYIANSYPNGIQVANEMAEVKFTMECELAMRKIQDKLDYITRILEQKAGELDKLIEPLQKPLDTIKTYLGMIQGLMNMSISLDTVVSAVTNLINLVAWIFGMVLKPYIESIDQVYKVYRDIKVTAGVELSKLLGLVNIECVVTCKYVSNQFNCPVLKKLGIKTCPLLKVFGSLADIGNTIQKTIDSATSPVDTILDTINPILKMSPITQVVERNYPSIKLKEVQIALEEIASESQMNQSGIISQPPVSDEMKSKI